MVVRASHPSGLVFIATANGGEVGDLTIKHRRRGLRDAHVFEHLSCFLPGTLALGAHYHAGLNATWEWELARSLLDTCDALYSRHPTGLGVERVGFVTARDVGAEETAEASDSSPRRDVASLGGRGRS